jgi:hypothetical protein
VNNDQSRERELLETILQLENRVTELQLRLNSMESAGGRFTSIKVADDPSAILPRWKYRAYFRAALFPITARVFRQIYAIAYRVKK